MVQSADAAPTKQEREVLAQLSGKLDQELAALHAIETGALAAFNRMIRELNVPAAGAGRATRRYWSRCPSPRAAPAIPSAAPAPTRPAIPPRPPRRASTRSAQPG